MNIGDTFFPGLKGDSQFRGATGDLANVHPSMSPAAGSTELRDSALSDYATGTSASQRAIVERRFMRMSRAHDRIRMELLARDPQAR